MQYPKIETVWARDEATFKTVPGRFRLPEFALPNRWLVTEKIDGMNIRIILSADGTAGGITSVAYGGKTDAAQIPAPLLAYLQAAFPVAAVAAAFDPGTSAVVYAEGYGPKIQSGGDYRAEVGVRIFDVVVFGGNGRPWWLEWDAVEDVARKLGARAVPVLAEAASLDEALSLVAGPSLTAAQDGGRGRVREGVVARTRPLLLRRNGERLMWKLKVRDC